MITNVVLFVFLNSKQIPSLEAFIEV